MIEEFITSIVSSALVSGAVVWLSKAWISERLKNAIKNEYDQKLEKLDKFYEKEEKTRTRKVEDRRKHK